MTRFLYLDSPSGVSGDMFLGAFLDDLVPVEYLKEELKKLHLKGYKLHVENTTRHSIRACQVSVQITQEEKQHRHLSDIESVLSKSSLSKFVKTGAQEVFLRLGEAEARVHGIPLEKVHFHEVGAVDSIVDIVGSLICLEYLKVDKVYTSTLPLSRGIVVAAHGAMAIPAPATLRLLEDYPVHYVDVEGELVTPTGAALVTTFSDGLLPEHVPFSIEKVGYGAGSRDFPELPNVLRIWVGTLSDTVQKETVLEISVNIDDMNPEWHPYLMEKLLQGGALDVSLSQVLMKKGRPGVLLNILCAKEKLPAIRNILFTESSTIGFRYHPLQRECLPRTIKEIDSPWGKMKVKEVLYNGRKRILPEYEECKRISEERAKPLPEVYAQVQQYLLNFTPNDAEGE
ncbi:MAG: nickel pincer cofactor biosynthesis protein LarC [Calditrichaeota bacterium]|nr:MAG: nickel pincer cofactor biosynthesis protein LarC [Calditrichota bacterium]